MQIVERQVVEIYPYKSFKEKLRLVDELRKTNNCKIEVFEGFLFIETSQLVPGEYDFKTYKSIDKCKRRKGNGKKSIRK